MNGQKLPREASGSRVAASGGCLLIVSGPSPNSIRPTDFVSVSRLRPSAFSRTGEVNEWGGSDAITALTDFTFQDQLPHLPQTFYCACTDVRNSARLRRRCALSPTASQSPPDSVPADARLIGQYRRQPTVPRSKATAIVSRRDGRPLRRPSASSSSSPSLSPAAPALSPACPPATSTVTTRLASAGRFDLLQFAASHHAAVVPQCGFGISSSFVPKPPRQSGQTQRREQRGNGQRTDHDE